MSGGNKKLAGLPSDDELRALILAAGYPLELRLLHLLTAEGFSPLHGTRVAVGDETKELDLLTSCKSRVKGPPNELHGMFELRMLIEAKKLHPPRCFVGFVTDANDPWDVAFGRTHVGGSPSWNAGQAPVPDYVKRSGYLDALSPLSHVPLCIQWGAVCERKQGRLELAHEDSIHEDMEKAVRASLVMETEITNTYRAIDDPMPFPFQVLHCPTLVFDTPNLYVFDVKADKLSRTDWLVVRAEFESRGGVVTRMVDIVTEAAMPALIAAHKQALANLCAVLARDFTSISDAGVRQRA